MINDTPKTTSTAMPRWRKPTVSTRKIRTLKAKAQSGTSDAIGATSNTSPKEIAQLSDKIPQVINNPVTQNHIRPSKLIRRALRFTGSDVTNKITPNDTVAWTIVANIGLGISSTPSLVKGCVIPRAKDAPRGKTNTQIGQFRGIFPDPVVE